MSDEIKQKNKNFIDNFEITDIVIHLNNFKNNSLRAYARICINDCLFINNLRIMDGKNGIFVSMPQEQQHMGTYINIVSVHNEEIKKLISDKVISQYFNIYNQYLENQK